MSTESEGGDSSVGPGNGSGQRRDQSQANTGKGSSSAGSAGSSQAASQQRGGAGRERQQHPPHREGKQAADPEAIKKPPGAAPGTSNDNQKKGDRGAKKAGSSKQGKAGEEKKVSRVSADEVPKGDGSNGLESQLDELKVGEGQAGNVEDEEGPVKLFVGGLSWDTTEATLRQVFQVYGQIADVSIMRNPKTNMPRGFGFVTLQHRKDAEAACKDKHTIDGRVVEAKISAPPGSPGNAHATSKRNKVFVGGLNSETTDEDFRKYFEQFGEIAESQILQDHFTGRSRGFGFITFTSEEATERVFAKGSFHELNGKLVEVKSATPRTSGSSGMTRMYRNNRHGSGGGGAGGGRSGGGRRGNLQNLQMGGAGAAPFGVDPGLMGYPGYYPPYSPLMQPGYMYDGSMGIQGFSPIAPFPAAAGSSVPPPHRPGFVVPDRGAPLNLPPRGDGLMAGVYAQPFVAQGRGLAPAEASVGVQPGSPVAQAGEQMGLAGPGGTGVLPLSLGHLPPTPLPVASPAVPPSAPQPAVVAQSGGRQSNNASYVGNHIGMQPPASSVG